MSNSRLLIPLTLSAFLLAASAPPAHATSYEKCGNGTVNQGEQCDDGNTTSGDGCQSNCTVQDGYECTGSPSICAPQAEVTCGDGIVDEGEECDGGTCCTAECTFKPSTTTCRGAAGVCDAAEKCTGASSTCPADQLKPSTTICRAAVPDCVDTPEYCTGTSVDCPPGAAPTCGNGVLDAGEGCDDGNTTNGDGCQSNCMVQNGYECTGSPSICAPQSEVDCGDGVLDEGEECDGGECCTTECTVIDDCEDSEEICRSPGFWSHRGTLIDDILEQTGPLQICGETVDSGTDLGAISSTVEALCVSTRGVAERSLFRQLVAASLNCAISEGETCDDVLGRLIDVSFTECSELCAGGSSTTGVTTNECTEQLDCFNNGGRVIDGECAFGTCEDDPTVHCGGGFGSCDDDGQEALGGVGNRKGSPGKGNHHKSKGIKLTHSMAWTSGIDDSDENRCIRFDDSCAEQELCNADTDATALICPSRTRVADNSACKEARKNQCTIDSCN